MAKDFITQGHNLDRLVEKATTQDEDINQAFERMKTELHGALGMIVPEPSANEILYGRQARPGSAGSDSPVVTTGPFVRVVYPAGNSRFEIYSDSEAGLDAQEARIRSLYPQQ